MSYIKNAFAENGDKTNSDNLLSDNNGDVTFSTGYTAEYEISRFNGFSSRSIGRRNFNGILNVITSAIKRLQQIGVADPISDADNGGAAFRYERGAMVRTSNGTVYLSKRGGNTLSDNPPPDRWTNLSDIPDNIPANIGEQLDAIRSRLDALETP